VVTVPYEEISPKIATGITLIALIITIIIMLILAGVTISIIMNGGLFDQAQKAREETIKEAGREDILIAISNLQIDHLGQLTLETIRDEIQVKDQTGKIIGVGEIEDDELDIDHINGYTYTVDGDFNIIVQKRNIIIEYIYPNGTIGVVAKAEVRVKDNSGKVDVNSLRYIWTASKTEPTEAEIGWQQFNSGDTIEKNIGGLNETYYLWVKAKDTEGNEQIKRSKGFNEIQVKSITLDKIEINMEIGEPAVQIIATVLPIDATNKNLIWTSSNSGAVTVDNNGTVTGIKSGKATITATAEDGSNVSATCEVNVTQPISTLKRGDYVNYKPIEREIIVTNLITQNGNMSWNTSHYKGNWQILYDTNNINGLQIISSGSVAVDEEGKLKNLPLRRNRCISRFSFCA
jgi:hypothetical protein